MSETAAGVVMALGLAATGRDNLREKMKGVKGTKSLEEEGRGREGEAEESGWVQKDCWLVSNSREHQKRRGRGGTSDSGSYFEGMHLCCFRKSSIS